MPQTYTCNNFLGKSAFLKAFLTTHYPHPDIQLLCELNLI